jgi:hypothetical protein
LGVIEGWGKTDVGTKGFRCEYAKIKAIYVKPSWTLPKAKNLFDVLTNLVWLLFVPAMYLTLIVISSGATRFVNAAWLLAWALATILFGKSRTLSPKQIKQVKQKYPDAKIYRNYEKMLKENPVSYRAGEVT